MHRALIKTVVTSGYKSLKMYEIAIVKSGMNELCANGEIHIKVTKITKVVHVEIFTRDRRADQRMYDENETRGCEHRQQEGQSDHYY